MTWEYDQYLAHHGIKGQKWGQRRFQNLDGSLTEEGKARYITYKSKYGDLRITERQSETLQKMPASRKKWLEKKLANGEKWNDLLKKSQVRNTIKALSIGATLAALNTYPFWERSFKAKLATAAVNVASRPKVQEFLKKRAWKKAGYVVLNRKNFTLGRGWIG